MFFISDTDSEIDEYDELEELLLWQELNKPHIVRKRIED